MGQKTLPPQNLKNSRRYRIAKWVFIGIGVVGVVWAAVFAYILWFDWVYIVHGPEYQTVEKQCGHKPVTTTTDLTGSGSYYLLPTDSGYQGPMGGLSFCTEQEAINKGFKHQPSAEADRVTQQCQHSPVVVERQFDSQSGHDKYLYQLPKAANSVVIPELDNKYYCTEQEAISAGYAKNQEQPYYG